MIYPQYRVIKKPHYYKFKKNPQNVVHNQEKSLIKANSKMAHMLNLIDKDFKLIIMNIFKQGRENIILLTADRKS